MSETDKTFTQEEVNQIVAKRLRDEQKKFEAEYRRKENLLTAKADWAKRGLPVELLDKIDISEEGSFDAVTSILENMRTESPNGSGGFAQKRIPDSNDMSQSRSEAQSIREAMGLNRKD